MKDVKQIEQVQIVEILPMAIWIESDMFGGRAVMLQHQGCDPFEYARFGYDYRYTSNAGTHAAAVEMAKRLGATEPVEERNRGLKFSTAEELQEQIKVIQQMLANMEKEQQ